MLASTLSNHRLPRLRFADTPGLSPALRPIWAALRSADPALALRLARTELRDQACGSDRAPLLLAMAAAESRLGHLDTARRFAEQSLLLNPAQHAAHRVIVTVFAAEQDFEAAYLYLSTLTPPVPPAGWDEALPPNARHLALAAWAWETGAWDEARIHLGLACPDLTDASDALLEDAFRLALYREDAPDAAAIATRLIALRSTAAADAVLQALVQKGWTAEALPLYRTLFEAAPEEPLLRRRLVGLCLREGALDEARRLAAPAALDLAA